MAGSNRTYGISSKAAHWWVQRFSAVWPRSARRRTARLPAEMEGLLECLPPVGRRSPLAPALFQHREVGPTVAELFGSQESDGTQACVAHQVSDVQSALAAGDAIFAPAMLSFLQRAVHLGRMRTGSGCGSVI